MDGVELRGCLVFNSVSETWPSMSRLLAGHPRLPRVKVVAAWSLVLRVGGRGADSSLASKTKESKIKDLESKSILLYIYQEQLSQEHNSSPAPMNASSRHHPRQLTCVYTLSTCSC
jgi:hypothetical protein